MQTILFLSWWFMISDQMTQKLLLLGERLRNERLKRDESQQAFATRLGVSVPTLHKMENGDHRVQFGHWVAALSVLGHEEDLDLLLAPEEDLFIRYDQQKHQRQRASRKSSK
ncbi:helix-turn-helix transcriptional regulator [uncultured Desulfuromonas sp.]|uniref:helix-turn-helix domain-containing protein n=1 Tax=uncultured Desulfuromonas sp. TaxID=181013 RepID=UPI002AAB4704|nr:helix-turn-helix transcriptional regulator [uncultured Desulfuromonas sp.]